MTQNEMNINEAKKEPVTRKPKIEISIQGYQNVISIGKDVVRLLGSPTYVCLRIHTDGSRIILAPCAADDVMSFKVPENLFKNHRTVFRLHSKQFVHSLMMENGMDRTLSYTVPGFYNEKQNVACFDLKENRLYDQRRQQKQ